MVENITPTQLRAYFDAMSVKDKEATGLKVHRQYRRKNGTLQAVTEYIEDQGQFTLSELKQKNLIPNDMDSTTFRRGIVQQLVKSHALQTTKGLLSHSANLYHLPSHTVTLPSSAKQQSIVFTEPSQKAAEHLALAIKAQKTKIVDARSLIDKKTYPFYQNGKTHDTFRDIMDRLARSKRWSSTSVPFQYVRGDL